MKRRLLSILLSLCMALTMFPAGAFAAQPEQEQLYAQMLELGLVDGDGALIEDNSFTVEDGTRLSSLDELTDWLNQCTADELDTVITVDATGRTATAEQLKVWVDYANEHGSVILFDSAYEAFISEPGIPHSIYEVEGAKTCAIEFRSFSKTAGFTGTRCAYTVVPKELVRGGASLNSLWNRRQCTKFNGASYIIQRGAAAIYTEEGEHQIEETLAYYRNNARVIKEGLEAVGFTV